jgi:xanthine dehydrogenase/oxidase
MEELRWGSEREHTWARPGYLATNGPGSYKIPTANDIPLDLRVTLLDNAPNRRAVHSSKAVGEPPLHLGASVYFALKDAVYSARESAGAPVLGGLSCMAASSHARIWNGRCMGG